MDYYFDNERPIYIQLVEKLRIEIVSGKLKPGERIPSVRELALALKVNPNTMQKALSELETEGLVFTERTNGKFVTENNKLIEKMKNDIAKEVAKKYFSDMKNIGIDFKEATNYLQKMGKENE